MAALGMCEMRIWSGHSFYPCSNKAKVERNGHRYCGIHDEQSPAKLKRKADQKAKWEAESKKWDEERRRRHAIAKLCGHLSTDEIEQSEVVRKNITGRR